MSKYIDLMHRIDRDKGFNGHEYNVVWLTLDWLDNHPDHVPGRTITASEWSEYVNSENGKYLAGAGLLKKAGVTIVPDPEPTNVEKLKDLHDQYQQAPGLSLPGKGSFAEYLDAHGVKAPGVDHG